MHGIRGTAIFFAAALVFSPMGPAVAADALTPVTGAEMEGDKRDGKIGATGELVEGPSGEAGPVQEPNEALPVLIEVTVPPAPAPVAPLEPSAPEPSTSLPSAQAPLQAEAAPEPTVQDAPAVIPQDIPRINKEDLLRRVREGQDIIIIDARSRKAFAHSLYKLPNAYRIPLSHIKRLAPLLPPGRDIIIYCDTAGEVIASHAAAVLINDGYKNIFVLSGGFNEWVFFEYPLELK
jgi:rhodanese-related sulfurtransferase